MHAYIVLLLIVPVLYILGEKVAFGLRPPSPLVRVAGATLLLGEEVVSSKLIN